MSSNDVDKLERKGLRLAYLQHQMIMFSYSLVFFWTLALLNCRNIVTVDHEPDPADNAAYERHFGVPMTKYKTLAIKPMGKRYEHDDQPQQQFDIMPLHIRRGHFKTFTAENPRFGYNHPSNIGTFWNQATAVGNAKNGVVVKDYEIKGDPDITE